MVSKFQPEVHGLPKNFKLIEYCDVDVWHAIQLDETPKIAENSSALISEGKVLLEHNGDFFGPIIENPIILGRIAFISALSNLNAVGIPLCTAARIQVFEQKDMESWEKRSLTKLLTNGFEEAAKEMSASTSIASVLPNRNLGIRATVSILTDFDGRISVGNAKDGDVLVLTKPLGTSVVLSAYELFHQPAKGQKIRSIFSEADMQKAYQLALKTITATNVKASILMKKHGARGAICIGKRGILGHTEDWNKLQKDPLFFFIQNLPLIHKTAALDKAIKKKYNLLEGYAPEICGGLLICFEQKQAAKFCTEFNTSGDHAWIVGTVHADQKCAKMSLKRRVIEVI